MLSKLKTCVLYGLEGYGIDVETDLSNGLPGFTIVGLPDISIRESKERVRSAIKNSGYKFPVSRITVNLAPANLKKEGSQIDLPIAIGILAASKIVEKVIKDDTCIIGELSLDGKINAIEGALPMVISMRNNNFKRVIIPVDNKEECGVIEGIDIIPVSNLNDLVDYINNEIEINSYSLTYDSFDDVDNYSEDFSEIKGQPAMKRAVEIAAAGMHNLLLLGSPGSGKTMIARRIPTILPDLTFEESMEVTKIYSISGQLKGRGLVKKRPFRSPHHTSSRISIAGGGSKPNPGEVSLAHYGVLFLDEIPEFPKNVLEVLRQPMEDGSISISRANGSFTFPAKFMMVASMNPCPCGYLGDPTHECSCNQGQIDKYLNKISGPLLNRIDIQLEVSPVKYDDLNDKRTEETSKDIKKRIIKARSIQKERYYTIGIMTNSELSGKNITKYCKINKDSELLLKSAFETLGLSARAYNKILKVARTIADLEASENIETKHLAEAIQYRSLDRKYWR
ncbi:magnesium chelatase family protein [Sedimentibacter acidaminivorans]|uniref:Magnesium chelatase family protein n=1 Tax=Sedimentibacter acidaminivorans TaxID=913099 RepID=A0ABS4GIK7_9FIRM|nr:YifB family Mg chelatase-like AAA ATPase [Sedimentibacter acidaminivorans]MBP1927372.1 magnesium chelatase family protein [Sedimentibacter acidaminivorans]